MHRAGPEIRKARYDDTLSLRRLLPVMLGGASFYERREELKPLWREWDIRFANPLHCFEQHSSHSCGPLSLKTVEVLISRRPVIGVDEDHIADVRMRIAERIYSFCTK